MSSNPPDPNDLVRMIMQQLQQRPQPQQPQQARPPPVPVLPPYNQGAVLPQNPDNSVGNLVARYLNASQGHGQMGAATNMPPAAAPASLPQSSNDITRSLGQATSNQLLALTGLLSSLNQNLAAAAAAQQIAPHGFPGAQPQQDRFQQGLYSPQSQPVQQGLYPQGQQQGRIQGQQQGFIQGQQKEHIQQVQPFNQQQQQNLLSQLKNQDQAQPSSMQVDEDRSSNTVDLTQASVTTSTRAVVPSNQGSVRSVSEKVREQAPQPVSLAVLQTWTLEQLESYAKQLEDFNKPIPKIVRILLDDARLRKQKQLQKRLSNRKSATVSRARKRQLIEELTADNTRLRRQALILSYLPDPVIAIGMDGIIKFCNTQIERVLNIKSEDLVGASIKDIMMPESRGAIRRLVQDLVTAERLAAIRESSGADGGSGEVVSSDQSFSVLEVNFDGEDDAGKADENMSDSSGDPRPAKKERTTKVSFGTAKPCSRSITASAAEEDSGEPPVKKSKTAWTSSSDSKTSGDTGMNVDDVMGASVTANNASAKLSSLIHKESDQSDDRKPSAEEKQQEPFIHRKHGMAPKQQDSRSSSSSTESDGRTRTGVNSSEDSGYMDSNSNGSSDESPEDSSDSFWKKGNRPRPLAPGAMVRLICSDLSTMWCELTSSIRTRNNNDEDPEIGIVDLNPSKQSSEDDPEDEEVKEVLLCFRPILQGEKVGEEFRFPQQVSESSNAGNNESEQSEN